MSDSIFISGGAGFLGFHLAKKLVEDGYMVTIADNFERAVNDNELQSLLNNQNCNFFNINCLNKNQVLSLGNEFNYIFHMAAIIGVVHVDKDPYRTLSNNITMLKNLIEFAHNQKNLKRFLFPSTSEVYAGTLENYELKIPSPENTPLTVTDMKRPRTSYMLSKIVGEYLCQFSNLPMTIFRPHNVYGPRMGTVHVIPGQLKKAYYASNGDKVPVPSFDHTRTFCFVEDAVNMLCKIMNEDKCIGTILNVGNQKPEITIGNLSKICHKIVGKTLEIKKEPSPLGSPRRRAPDMNKTMSLIDHKQSTDLINGIKITYDWYLKNVFSLSGITAK